MGDERIRKVLRNFGLKEKEAEVYIFLAKHGMKRSGEIAKGLKIHRTEVYRLLKDLQTKGLVELTLEFPTRFTAIPFEKVLDSFINAKREEATLIEKTKQDLLLDWKSISKTSLELPPEKFMVIEGNSKIYAKISQMINETKSKLSCISTVSGLLRADQFGLLDAVFDHPLKSKIQFRFLTELTSENLNHVKTLLKRTPKVGFNLKGRNPELGLQLSPSMVIRDGEEILFYITPRTDTPTSGQEDVCLWTNCKTLVQSFIAVFEDLWRSSTDIEKKMAEIETGKPTPKTYIISDPEVAKEKYDKIINSAKEEILTMISSEDLLNSLKNITILKDLARRSISVKIMAPLTNDNLEAALQLSEYCKIRHVPTSYLSTTIVDSQHLFQFRNPQSEREKRDTTSRFENTFYTNDSEYVEKTKRMLEAVWENARAPSAVTLEAIVKPPTPTVAPVPEGEYVVSRKDSPYQKMLIDLKEKVGVITEKDVLNKIINAKRTPVKDLSKDIVRLYGSSASAVIHTPNNFNLPDMIIALFHCNKQSSFGAEDYFQVYLWLETPKGHAYVPVAVVGDNTRDLERRKLTFAGTPAGQNCRLLRKDEIQMQVHGNTLFAGWTVPIPLYPPQYVLPPASLLFEGYSKLKTVVTKIEMPSGAKVIDEGNGFDAFVTFFHPASKYAGPGTDGIFVRDMVMTVYPPN